ncbi:MAG: cupin [Chromatiales bacterium]|jgi:quercetin dioxygenase-like cupin family protein|nr:cupin [Chromatiales bacterium]MDP6150930.1 cupin domain-containing protein [Gammaproteobacteria bacterium]MDP7094479.1 cupin domain-containing protein [Gammaproteobacteria bacterium]MDP7270916.1 cupin domain-containing protein [Gammaproteobacteria bacterium]HJP05572.1 cupin domain-containing protein [Gammaproteobacteria bacterium]
MSDDWRYHKITRETAETYKVPSGEITYFLSTAAETDGKITVFDAYFPKGSGVPWHIHKIDEELFFVTSGKYKIGVADEEFELGVGEMAIAGIDVPRMFEAITDDAWIIVINSPAGPAENFIRYMQNLDLKGPPGPEVFEHCEKEFGVVFGKGNVSW